MAKGRKGADAPQRLRVNVSIDSTLRRRLGAYASAHGLTEGEVVGSALERHLAGFYFGHREPRSTVTVAGDEPSVLAIRTG